MDQAPPRSTSYTHLCYNQYLFSYSQGNFNIQRWQTPSICILQFYHPVRVFVKHHPKVILTILRREKHSVTLMLLYDTLRIITHKVYKAIECLTRDWCDDCVIHNLDVCNLVVNVYLVEMLWLCASRRDLFTKGRIKITSECSNNNDTSGDDTNQS